MSGFIHQALSPKVVIFSSEQVQQSCKTNGLRNLDELFKPWQNSIEKVSILSSLLTPTVHPQFAIRFVSHESLLQAQNGGGGAIPYSPEVVIDVIANLVGRLDPAQDLQYNVLRDVLLASSPIAEHETFNHPVSFLLAASTQSEDPVRDLHKLHAVAGSSPVYTSRGYMDGTVNSIQRFWLLVHDVAVSGVDMTRTEAAILQVKKTFGPHCGLLIINSQVQPAGEVSDDAAGPSELKQAYINSSHSLLLNDPFMRLGVLLTDNIVVERSSGPSEDSNFTMARLSDGFEDNAQSASRLTSADGTAIRSFLREFTSQSLVPWMEARVREWNEIYVNSRRGITGRFFGASRKFFGSGRSTPTQNLVYNSIRGYYPPSAPETVSRKLADFAFMLRDYRTAAAVYDSIRKDYLQDGAQKLSASATEMFCLSTLMNLIALPQEDLTTIQTKHALAELELLLEQSIATYLSRPQTVIDSMRVGLLLNEAWRSFRAPDCLDWSGTSRSLVRIATQVEDVPSAILLEQAAIADLKGSRQLKRKHAFHSVMAARRYEQSGQKAMSGRCLGRALESYRDQSPPWSHAQHYLEYALGRQAYTMGDSGLAVEHFCRMLRIGEVQAEQSGILENLALAYQQLQLRPDFTETTGVEPVLDNPIFQATGVSIILPAGESEEVLGRSDKAASTANEHVVGIHEAFSLRLLAHNPLGTTVRLTNINLRVENDFSNESSSSTKGILSIEPIPDLEIPPLSTRSVDARMTLEQPTTVHFKEVDYLFHGLMKQVEPLTSRGSRLHTEKRHRLVPQYDDDASLRVKSVVAMARLSVTLTSGPSETMRGVCQQWALQAINNGRLPIIKIRVECNHSTVFIKRKADIKPEPDKLCIRNQVESRTIAELDLSLSALEAGQSLEIGLESCFQHSGELDLEFEIFSETLVSERSLGTATPKTQPLLLTSAQDQIVCQQSLHHNVVVKPSLELAVQVAHPKRTAVTPRISMTITNRSEESVTLEGVCASSAIWQISDHSALNDRIHELQPGATQALDVDLVWHHESDIDALQKTAEIGASRVLGLEDAGIQAVTNTIHRSSRSYDDQPKTWPSAETWDCWRIQQRRDIAGSLAASDISANLADVAVLWRSDGSKLAGYISACNISIRPRHSPLVPTLVNMLKVDKAAARAMYEETNTRRRQILTSVLRGDMAREDNPLQLDVRYFSPEGADRRCSEIEYTFSNTSPLYEIDFAFKARDPAKRSYAVIGNRQISKRLKPQETITWKTAAMQMTESAAVDCLVAWQLLAAVGHTIDGKWQDRATFTMG